MDVPSPDLFDRRAAAFATLGRLHLTAPDSPTLGALSALLDEWPLAATAQTAAGLAELRSSFEAGESELEIRTDHNALYGVTARAKVPPYESVHRGEERLVFGTEAIEVRRDYRKLGLQAPRLNQEPDDHIGLEFNFMAHVHLRGLDALERGDSQAAEQMVRLGAEFMENHLLAWAPTMLNEAADRADTHFYRGVMLASLGALEDYMDLA